MNAPTPLCFARHSAADIGDPPSTLSAGRATTHQTAKPTNARSDDVVPFDADLSANEVAVLLWRAVHVKKTTWKVKPRKFRARKSKEMPVTDILFQLSETDWNGATTQEKPINSLPPFAPKPPTSPLRFPEACTSNLSDRPYDPLGQNPSPTSHASDRPGRTLPPRFRRPLYNHVQIRLARSDRTGRCRRRRARLFALETTTIAVCGLVIAVRRKGIMTHMILRNYVAGTGVELVIRVFSPLVSKNCRVEEDDRVPNAEVEAALRPAEKVVREWESGCCVVEAGR
ncbi:hypothetical protein BJ742DRAFT_908291 [Cladochytrium replicatum]|nr:hypothetical protein BJ742DRAFT_908291 [Cladochytrium replicatum]